VLAGWVWGEGRLGGQGARSRFFWSSRSLCRLGKSCLLRLWRAVVRKSVVVLSVTSESVGKEQKESYDEKPVGKDAGVFGEVGL